MYRTIVATTAAVTLAFSGAAFAKDKSSRNAGLPSLDDVKPLPASALPSAAVDDGFFRNFQLSVEGSYGEVKHKAGQPAALRQYAVEVEITVNGKVLFSPPDR